MTFEQGSRGIIQSSVFSDNTVLTNLASGAITNFGDLIIEDSQFENHISSPLAISNQIFLVRGGVISNLDGNLFVDSVIFRNSQTSGGLGAALYASRGQVTLTRSSFFNSEGDGVVALEGNANIIIDEVSFDQSSRTQLVVIGQAEAVLLSTPSNINIIDLSRGGRVVTNQNLTLDLLVMDFQAELVLAGSHVQVENFLRIEAGSISQQGSSSFSILRSCDAIFTEEQTNISVDRFSNFGNLTIDCDMNPADCLVLGGNTVFTNEESGQLRIISNLNVDATSGRATFINNGFFSALRIINLQSLI